MIIHPFDQSPSLFLEFVAELRNVEIQKDRMRFRRNLERIGELLSYEMSKTLPYQTQRVVTPLGEKDIPFISAYRKHTSPSEFEILVEYLASPSLQDNILILADPMLATGRSFVNVYNSLQPLGTPKEIHLFAVIGSKQGLEYVSQHFPENAHLWIATIDDHLNENSYIVPGLGDAGDLAFGEKMQG